MRLESVTLSGFRCFGPDPLKVPISPEITAVVGPNAAGKTALLKALSKVFGVSRAERTIHRSDFHLAADADPDDRAAKDLFIDVVIALPELADGAATPETVAQGIALYTSYAEGARLAPFFQGAGKPPVPETSTSVEAGLKLAGPAGLTGTIAAYRLERRNVPTANPAVPFTSVQTGEQRSKGVEADLVWEPSRHISVLADYAYTDAQVTADSRIPLGRGFRASLNIAGGSQFVTGSWTGR